MSEEETSLDINRSVLRVTWQHHWCSFEQFLDEAGSLSEEEFGRDLGLSYGSLHGIIAHLIGSEMVWLRRVSLNESVMRIPGREEMPDFAAIRNAWEETRDGWRRVLETEDLGRVIHYRNTSGQEFSDPVWLVMAHLVDHSAQYRGILISALRILGRKPPASGVILYTRSISRSGL